MKRPDGVVAIAIYYAIVAVVFLIGSCAILLALLTAVSRTRAPGEAVWAAFGIGVGLLFALIFLVGSIVAAWGLLALKQWGRWTAVALAVLQLVGFPIFTIIGGFIIYYLLREDTAAAFDGHLVETGRPTSMETGRREQRDESPEDRV